MTKQDLIDRLQARGQEQEKLWAEADRIRKETLGEAVHLRGIIEFSNYCVRNCVYCGLRRDNRRLLRYRMSVEEILQAARIGTAAGYKTIVLQSGEDPWYDVDKICTIVREIKQMGVAVTLSLGERPKEELAQFRQAGADRYLLKHETIDPDLYARLHPRGSYRSRIGALYTLKELGYQVGTGIMVGLPGQGLETIAADILFMKEFAPAMVGIGVFIPHPNTPLGATPPGSVDITLNAVALTRLVLPDVHLPATTALATIDPKGRERALRAGANVIMPNITPLHYRRKYEIYPGKSRGARANHLTVREEIEDMIRGLGRTVAQDHGHYYRRDANVQV
ncbi:MAG TPA: [FeFe] hydrogenase H-cluster radical SAM maturase HydE [Firmicutes bacterium]|nr:[FeFe] hydrogenase H-cluster radical SAM maturase HydE [Bacillota bacterium]